MLDRTEQRIVGVLIEKERTVPDTYPLSENALLAGCNQSSNREPVLSLQPFEIAGACMSLQQKGWIARIDGGSRVTKYRHKVIERLGLTDAELGIFAELLLRGPQAPGALKPRVARFGFVGEAEQVETVLKKMASRPQPLVEQLPLAPRERDHKWRHLVGDGSERDAGGAASGAASAGVPSKPALRDVGLGPTAAMPAAVNASAPLDLAARVSALEAAVAELRARLDNVGA